MVSVTQKVPRPPGISDSAPSARERSNELCDDPSPLCPRSPGLGVCLDEPSRATSVAHHRSRLLDSPLEQPVFALEGPLNAPAASHHLANASGSRSVLLPARAPQHDAISCNKCLHHFTRAWFKGRLSDRRPKPKFRDPFPKRMCQQWVRKCVLNMRLTACLQEGQSSRSKTDFFFSGVP